MKIIANDYSNVSYVCKIMNDRNLSFINTCRVVRSRTSVYLQESWKGKDASAVINAIYDIVSNLEKEVDEINVALSMIINYAKDTEEDIIDRNQKILGLY